MKSSIISMLCITLAFVIAASCNKMEGSAAPVEGDGRTVINGVAETIGGGTKADMAYLYEVIWRTGDKIYVTDGINDDTFSLDGGEGTSKGRFTEDNAKGINGDIEACYPA